MDLDPADFVSLLLCARRQVHLIPLPQFPSNGPTFITKLF